MKNNFQKLSVDSKRSIKHLSKKAWRGIDASAEISLFEYDLIWKEKKDEFQFIHLCSHRKGFTFGWFKKTLDFAKEFSWVKWDEFLSFIGDSNFDEWNKLPFGHKISDLVSYYGIEHIFGTDYHEGFNVKFV